ncbi:MAG: hypothetical protein RRY29_09605 [Desulfovibrionaceae bacterium]
MGKLLLYRPVHAALLSCLVVWCCLLQGCLVPDKYYATLSLSNHAYSYDYVGDIHMAAAYSDTYLRQVDNDPQKLADRVLKEFVRVIRERQQSSVKVALLSPTTFKTQFLYVSSYAMPEATGMFTFSIAGDTLTVVSRPLSTSDREFLRLNDISSQGTLCIKAFGTVIESNAHKAATMLNRCNEWNLTDLESPIRMVIKYPQPIEQPAPKE